jgi:hypothetical protein
MKFNPISALSIASVVLSVAGAWCVGYSVIDRFQGAEYGGLTADNADGKAHKTLEYAQWESRNTAWTRVGIILITVGGFVQIVSLFVPPPDG